MLKSLYLDGIVSEEKKLLIPLCPDIQESNVCCNNIDSIKIYKHWNQYSLAKIDSHVEKMNKLYQSFFAMEKIAKSLNPNMIPYHKVQYIWKKKEVKKCFDAEVFTREKKIENEIRSQKLGKAEKELWKEKNSSHLIVEIV